MFILENLWALISTIGAFGVLVLLIINYRNATSLKAQDVVQDIWTKYSKTIATVGAVVLVSIFRFTTQDQFDEIFGELGGLVALVDKVVASVGVIYGLITAITSSKKDA